MTSIWVETLGRSFEQALVLLAAVVRDCTDELWQTAMWEVPPPEPGRKFLRPDWSQVQDPEERGALAEAWVRRWSTPWAVAWHACELLDYDVNGEFGPWAPPPPFTGHPHWRDLAGLPTAWSRSEMLAYIAYCREKVRATLAGMTEETAAAPLPPAHRYRGQPHAQIITALVGHTTEHATQIRQFITAAGIARGA